MKYVGSKNRLAKHILPIILERRTTETYVEPFAGGMNLIQHVSGDRIANDLNPYIVAMFKALVEDDWIPPSDLSEQQYHRVKEHPELFPDEYVGFVAVGCSYGGKWWGGFARGKTKEGKPRNYCLESKNNILKQKEKLKGVDFYSVDYSSLCFPSNSIVYCDIPYKGTVKYKDKFDHNKFWDWAKELSKHQTVYVSEYSAPEYVECVWSKPVTVSIDSHKTKKTTEKLYKL